MDIVEIERRGAVALLTLNRPQALNALDVALLETLEARIGEVARDPHARRELSRNAQAAIDGYGALRVAFEIARLLEVAA